MQLKLTCSNNSNILGKQFNRTPKKSFRPSEFLHAVHMYYVKYEDAFTCKTINWDSGGLCYFFLFSYMFNTKMTILAQK